MRQPMLFALRAAVGVGCQRVPSALEGLDWQEHQSAEGRFSVLMPPGTLKRESRTVDGVPLTMEAMKTSDEVYSVVFGDVPAGQTFSLDKGVAGVSESLGGRSFRLEGGAHDWRDFEIEGTKYGYASGRAVFTRGRVYLIVAMGADARLSSSQERRLVASFKLTDGVLPWSSTPPASVLTETPGFSVPIFPPPASPSFSQPNPLTIQPPRSSPPERILGHPTDTEFRDVAPEGGLLVGFDVGLHTFINYDTLCTARPLFRVGEAEVPGQLHGSDTRRMVRVKAAPGYAVGAITVKAGLGVDGMSVTFMRVNGRQLDPKDSYRSAWLGGPNGGGPVVLGGDGTPVIGIRGRVDRNNGLTGLGLAFGR